jgi:hypothetical protein
MQGSHIFLLVCAAVLVVLGAGFIILCILQWRERKYLLQVCTVETKGTVVDVEITGSIKKDEEGDEIDRRSFYPVFEYEAGGKTYRQRSSNSLITDEYNKLSRVVNIWYNPGNHDEYYALETLSGSIFSRIVLSVVGSILVTAGVSLAISVLK